MRLVQQQVVLEMTRSHCHYLPLFHHPLIDDKSVVLARYAHISVSIMKYADIC
jgi:hypothetical protein